MNIEKFTTGYITAALWSSHDDSGEPLDDSYGAGDLTQEAREAMESDCLQFFQENLDDLSEHSTSERAGHDFWLTRNGHGAGFWDRGLGEVGDRLTAASKMFGGVDLYVCDEKVHQC